MESIASERGRRGEHSHRVGVRARRRCAHTKQVANRVLRFTWSERAVHWLTAVAFFSLLVSGLVVGRRGTFHDVMYAWHLASAGGLVGGVALIVMTGDRRALRRTASELGRLDAEDREWLRAIPARLRAGAPEPPAGRFN